MNKLTTMEANFMGAISKHLKPDTSKQEIINIFRYAVKQPAKPLDRGDYQGDVTWTDDDLLKGRKTV